jgi:retron-type reverse transcriptase
MKSVNEFIEKKLKLKVNEKKSKVDKPWKRKFLGYSFFMHRGRVKRVIDFSSLDRFKEKVRKITSPSRRVKFLDLIKELRLLLVGWKNYFILKETAEPFRNLDVWIRHRLRSYIWHQWPKVRTR